MILYDSKATISGVVVHYYYFEICVTLCKKTVDTMADYALAVVV